MAGEILAMFLLYDYAKKDTFHVETDHPFDRLQNGGQVAKALVFGGPSYCRLVERAALLSPRRSLHRSRQESQLVCDDRS